MLTPFGPRERCGPRLGLGLDRIGPSSQQQFDQLHTAPATRPPERRTLQEIVPDVRVRPRIQQDGRQRHPHSMVSCDYFVQHRLSRFACSKIGIAALENQPKRLAAVRVFGVVQVLVPRQRTPQHPEPSRVVPCQSIRSSAMRTMSALRPVAPRALRKTLPAIGRGDTTIRGTNRSTLRR